MGESLQCPSESNHDLMVTVSCSVCGWVTGSLEAPSEFVASEGAFAEILYAHANPTHRDHPLLFDVKGNWKGPTHNLVITCSRCDGEKTFPNIPPFLIGACTLAFHSAHEGHWFKAKWGEYEWGS